jgi:hypothetical protein
MCPPQGDHLICYPQACCPAPHDLRPNRKGPKSWAERALLTFRERLAIISNHPLATRILRCYPEENSQARDHLGRGFYHPPQRTGENENCLEGQKGDIKFVLGEKTLGEFALVKTEGRQVGCFERRPICHQRGHSQERRSVVSDKTLEDVSEAKREPSKKK